MTRIAILGGGIAGLAAAYELEKARKRNPDLDWHLYEASNRLGGIIETTRIETPEGTYILEGGPDAWVTEKPWARELAIELGLGPDLIESNDATRKTYIAIGEKLIAMPAGMRMMVPEDLTTLDDSPLFSAEAKDAYAAELARALELREAALDVDESVAAFTLRHFGQEVLTKIAAPLLSGVFGGDVHKLSVRAVMPAFVAMEREHGSLIAALQSKQRSNKPQATFTSLRNGMASLTEALIATLPAERLHLNRTARGLKRERKLWCLRTTETGTTRVAKRHFNHIVIATPINATRTLIAPLDTEAADLIPTNASSAILAAFTWPAAQASTFTIPQGFGFLVPQTERPSEPSLLAATFVDQKFPHRAPPNARILRAFFGGASAETLAQADDATIAQTALMQLSKYLGPLPPPEHTTIRRWPRSLPQYEVGHIERIAELQTRIAALGNLTLLGNAYNGVGLPDLIRNAGAAVRKLTEA